MFTSRFHSLGSTSNYRIFRTSIKTILIFFILLTLILPSGCKSNLTDPNDLIIVKKWNGQVVSEVVFSILKPDSTVWTWGVNYCGTLGNGTNINSDYPVKVLNIKNVITMDLTQGGAIAADKDGNIWFWGNYWSYYGLPGIDTNITIPVKIANLKNVKSISAWGPKVHLLTNDGYVYYMNIHPYTNEVLEGPLRYSRIEKVISINKFSALRSDGEIYRLSINQLLPNVPEKVIMHQRTQFRDVVLKSDGTVWAWGDNSLGQLGNGTFENSDLPTNVKNLSDIISISSNFEYNLALKKDGTVWFWGCIGGVQTDSTININTPIKIEGLEKVVLIYATYDNIVMKEDGTYWTFTAKDRIPVKVQLN